MTKSILFNVSSTQLVNILNGTQTTLLTKRLPKDFVGWVYLACGKAKPYLFDCIDFHKEILEKLEPNHKRPRFITELFDPRIPLMWEINGKIVARFWWDGRYNSYGELIWDKVNKTYHNKDLKQYELIITNLEIFDKPKELGEFYKPNPDAKNQGAFGWVNDTPLYVPLTKACQSWQYVWGRE